MEPDWEVLKSSRRYAEAMLDGDGDPDCLMYSSCPRKWLLVANLNKTMRHCHIVGPICREWLGLAPNCDRDRDKIEFCPFNTAGEFQGKKLFSRLLALDLIESPTFSSAMRQARESRKRRLRDIAERSGIGMGRLACIEYGGHRPTRRERERIAWAIFGGEE